MSFARLVLLAGVTLAGCSTAAPSHARATESVFAAAPARGEDPAAHGERAGSRPFRLRRSATLAEGAFHSQFRYEDGADDSAIAASFGYGYSDHVMFDVALGGGHDPTTLAVADDPGRLYDFGAQWRITEDADENRVAARMDVVLADAYAFESAVAPGFGFPAGGQSSSKVSFQPSLLANFPVGDEGIQLFASGGLRLGDRTPVTYAIGCGLRVPLGRLEFVTELDLAHQSADGVKVNESYITPGLEWTVRGRLELAVGVSIGLTDTSEDWMASATMGVTF